MILLCLCSGFGLLDQVGKNAFQTFFNLESYSMTFVIDTTGSMGDDIEQVKTTCIDIIRKVVGSPDVPYNYILVPFNDPGESTRGILHSKKMVLYLHSTALG